MLETRQTILKLLEDYKSKGIENSLDAGVVLPDTKNEFKTFKLELADFFGVSRVSFEKNNEISIINLANEPRCERSWKRDETVKDRGNGLYLSDRDASILGL